MNRMIGSHAAIQMACPYGCCTVYGKPCKKNLKAIKRSQKRAESRTWRREAGV